MLMTRYRVYKFTHEGHIMMIDAIRCEEQVAKELAQALAIDSPTELWEGPRRIARYEPQRGP